jgi:hypothetical protein
MNSSDEPTRFDSHQTKLTKKLAGVRNFNNESKVICSDVKVVVVDVNATS